MELDKEWYGQPILSGDWIKDLFDHRFTYEDLLTGLTQKKYTKIMVMTGAGISVSAGIPDFRSPDTGIYANLAEYDLPSPESLFELEYF
jgi:hypothetical protein